MGRINSNRFYCTRSASSPSQSSLRDASSPKVGALGSPRKLHLFAKASPFGRGVTVGDGEGEPAEIIRSCRMPLRPLPVKKSCSETPAGVSEQQIKNTISAATTTTAASGGNREELLGQRPARCECRPRHDANAGCRNPEDAARIPNRLA